MRVLFIGGTGNISTACTRLALERGDEIFLLNRGLSPGCQIEGARQIRADIRDAAQARAALKGRRFDAVVDWVAFSPEHIETDIALFRGNTGQYVFISSATVYRKPPPHYVVTESTPLGNPYWQYARDKIACEEILNRAIGEEGFPATIVRPSLTYGETWIPAAIGGHDYTLIDRMMKGGKVIVHGDGQSLWTMTHNSDFAKGLMGLLGNPATIGEHYHITSDEVLTWDAIYKTMGHAAGVDPALIHIPSELINAFDAKIGAGLLGDKAFSAVFDNSKIKDAVPGFRATVSFADGIRRCLEWFGKDEKRKIVSVENNRLMDRIVHAYLKAWPGQGE
jgi:nucleoside-diphosphate-sugar epimerase